MKIECRQEFLKHIVGVDFALCLGYDLYIDDIKVGMRFIVSPNFVFKDSNDKWTNNDAIRQRSWQLTETVSCHYNDQFEILNIVKEYKKPRFLKPHIRVRNLRTFDDFNIIVSNEPLSQYCTNNLYFIH